MKHCGVSGEKLKMFDKLILSSVSWSDAKVLSATAGNYFEGTSTEGYSAVVLWS